MTNHPIFYILMPALFLGHCAAFGQSELSTTGKIKKKVEERIRYYNDTDRTTLHHKTFDFDEKGCLIRKQEFYYNLTPAGSLAKDVNALYDTGKQLLTENIVVFKSNNEREFENLRTKYLLYAPTEEESKYSWRQYIDNSLDIVKEDTLTYDENLNLIKKCDYNYKGNTSLYCDEFTFDKHNRRRRWKMYTHWTTVKAVGKAVDKREKKLDYKYYFNRAGKPTKTKGKRYSTHYSEKWTYNKTGQLETYEERSFRKSLQTKKRRKETGERFMITEEIRLRQFNSQEKILSETYTRNNTVQQELRYVYENDTLLKSFELSQKGKKVQTIEYFYDAAANLVKKNTYSHDSKGIIRYYVQSDFNDKNQLLRETQIAKEEVLSRSIFEYNDYGDKISMTMFFKNDKIFEKTHYFYEYY